MIVCVLGMHRSGTSLVTRLLNVLGVYLGSESQLIRARADNPRGFWEHRRLQRLNDEILDRLGGNWAHLPPLQPGWERSPRLADLRHRARAIIQDDFARVPVWAWKDPTTSVTLPFWQDILPPMRYVICLRHPVESALSIQRRDGLSLEEGIDMWARHVKLALEGTAEQPRLLVFYERVMNDWRPVLRDLADFIGRPERADAPEVLREIASFVDTGLQHHRWNPGSADSLGLPIDVLTAIQHTYAELADQREPYQDRVIRGLARVLDAVHPRIKQIRHETHARWLAEIHLLGEEIDAVVPARDRVILVDQGVLVNGVIGPRTALPFLERDGQYWGVPPDDETAIQELERMRSGGASFIIFAWPALWWLDHFREFHHYLRSHFLCPLDNGRLVAFDLQTTAS